MFIRNINLLRAPFATTKTTTMSSAAAAASAIWECQRRWPLAPATFSALNESNPSALNQTEQNLADGDQVFASAFDGSGPFLLAKPAGTSSMIFHHDFLYSKK